MEQRAIIIAFTHQLHEVVAVDGCLVVQADYDVAQHGLYLYFFHKQLDYRCKVSKYSLLFRRNE